MAMKADHIRELIIQTFPDAQVVIEDLAGDGEHYKAIVRSSFFEGKSKVAQHQMVYKSLGGRMGNELHALSLVTEPLSCESSH